MTLLFSASELNVWLGLRLWWFGPDAMNGGRRYDDAFYVTIRKRQVQPMTSISPPQKSLELCIGRSLVHTQLGVATVNVW